MVQSPLEESLSQRFFILSILSSDVQTPHDSACFRRAFGGGIGHRDCATGRFESTVSQRKGVGRRKWRKVIPNSSTRSTMAEGAWSRMPEPPDLVNPPRPDLTGGDVVLFTLLRFIYGILMCADGVVWEGGPSAGWKRCFFSKTNRRKDSVRNRSVFNHR